jgi:hypothetical protein
VEELPSMIFSVLTTTHSEVIGGKFITLPNEIQEIFQVQENTKLHGYSNPDGCELYISLSELDIPLGAAMVYAPNLPGVMGLVASSFGKRDLNIIAFSSFGIGKSGMTELLAQEYKRQPKDETAEQEEQGFIGRFESAAKELENQHFLVHVQPLVRVMAQIPLLPKSAAPIPVKRHVGTDLLDLKVTDLVLDQLKLDSKKEYDVLLTYYVRFPLMVLKFVTCPSSMVRVIAQIYDEPNVLGRVCTCLQEVVNFHVGTVRYCMNNGSLEASRKASIELYGDLLPNKTKKDVEEALFSINKTFEKELINNSSISAQLISEIGRGS